MEKSLTSTIPLEVVEPGGRSRCIYCKDQWVEFAPYTEDHWRMVREAKAGARIEFYSWQTTCWRMGKLFKQYHNGLWEIKCDNDLPEDASILYHLPHLNFWLVDWSYSGRSGKRQLCDPSITPNDERSFKKSKKLSSQDILVEDNGSRIANIAGKNLLNHEVGTDACLVSYCDNNRGKGYRRLKEHIERQHGKELSNGGGEREMQ